MEEQRDYEPFIETLRNKNKVSFLNKISIVKKTLLEAAERGETQCEITSSSYKESNFIFEYFKNERFSVKFMGHDNKIVLIVW